MENGRIPKSGELYRHFKNKLYQVIGVAEHSETKEVMVVYQALYGEFKLYVRPLSIFQDEVDRTKYPLSEQKFRFEKIDREQLHEDKAWPEEAEDSFGKTNGALCNGKSEMQQADSSNMETDGGPEQEKQPRNEAFHIDLEHKEEEAFDDWRTQIDQKVSGLEAEMIKEAEKQKEEFEEAVREMEMSHLEQQRQEEEVNPLLLQFLDTDTYKQKLDLFLSMRKKIDDRLIDDIAAALDVVVDNGPLEVRYDKLKSCIETLERFECDRFF